MSCPLPLLLPVGFCGWISQRNLPGRDTMQSTGGAVDLSAVGVRERLQEIRAQGLEVIEVSIERRRRRAHDSCGREQQRAQ